MHLQLKRAVYTAQVACNNKSKAEREVFPIGSEDPIKPYMTPLNKGCLVDVGANFGIWTNYVAKRGFEVHAFEQSPRPYINILQRVRPMLKCTT